MFPTPLAVSPPGAPVFAPAVFYCFLGGLGDAATGCMEGFFEAEDGEENGIKSTKPVF